MINQDVVSACDCDLDSRLEDNQVALVDFVHLAAHTGTDSAESGVFATLLGFDSDVELQFMRGLAGILGLDGDDGLVLAVIGVDVDPQVVAEFEFCFGAGAEMCHEAHVDCLTKNSNQIIDVLIGHTDLTTSFVTGNDVSHPIPPESYIGKPTNYLIG